MSNEESNPVRLSPSAIGYGADMAAKNESGGEIIITLRQATCKQYSTAIFDGYAFAKNGRMLEFCWAVVDDMIRVVYLEDRSVRIYDPGLFSRKTDK